MKPIDGKALLNRTVKPCETRYNKNVEKLFRGMLSSDNWETLITFLWTCPIQKVQQCLYDRTDRIPFHIFLLPGNIGYSSAFQADIISDVGSIFFVITRILSMV